MALTELNIHAKKPKNLSKNTDADYEDEDDFELVDDGDTIEFDNFEDDFDSEEDDEKNTEEEVAEDEDASEEDENDDTEEDDSEEDEDEGDDTEENEVDDEESQGPRENERVRSVIAERNKERELRVKEHNRRISTEKKMQEMQKSMVENSIKTLKDQKSLLKRQLVQAQQDDDHEAAIELQEKLSETSVNLMAFESWKPEEITEKEIEIKEDVFDSAPDTVKEWANKNTWFRNPTTPEEKLKQSEAVRYSDELVKAGYSVESKEFFKKIDSHLKSKGLASEVENDVKSKKKSSKSSTRRKKKKISQTVQSASRTPASRKQSRKRKVTLNDDQKHIAEVMGLTELEYAQSLLEVEASEKAGNRMTTLKL
jgi:hypothetical protein